jgi:hypothetical protein
MTALRPRAVAVGLHSAPESFGGRCGVQRGAIAVAITLAASVLSLALAPAGAAAQLAVYPALVEFEAGPAVGLRTLTVENQGDGSMEVRVYLSDYDRDPDGDHIYIPYGEHEHSCTGRLQAFPDQLSVESGERGEIRLRLEEGEGSCWGLVFVEKRTLTPSGITVAQRIAVKVLAQPASASREGRVVGVAVDTVGGRAVVVGFENEGARALDVEGEVEIRDLAGDIVRVVAVERFHALPGRQRQVRVKLDEASLGDGVLAPGKYVLVAILDFGGDYLAGGQAILDVTP